jgi:hypothetical protein
MAGQDAFLRAYRRFSDQNRGALLRFVGWRSRSAQRAIHSILREGSWEARDRTQHRDAIRIMQHSSLLLANVTDEKCAHWIPGKLYEYLAAGRPILFVGPKEGNAAEIINRTRTGKAVGFDEDSILRSLEEFYHLWRNGYSGWNPDKESISAFDRKRQAGTLAGIFNNLTS